MNANEFRQVFPRVAKSLTEDQTTSLVAALTERRYAAGTRLATFGERTDTLHFVTGGQLAIRATQAGETLYLGHAGRGGLVGEVGLIEPGPASATVEALEDATTLDLDAAGLEKLCSEQPATANALLGALSAELAARLRRSSTDLLRRIDDHAWMRAEARRDRKGWLARLGDLLQGTTGSAP